MRNHLWRHNRTIFPLLLLLLLPVLAHAAPLAGEEDAGSPLPDGLLLEVRTQRAQVYVGQPVPLTVTLLAGPVTVRNIEYPRLDSAAFTLGEFGLPRRQSVVRDGGDFTAYQFTTTLTARRSGRFQLGPAELQCDMLAPSGGPAAFFGVTDARRVTVRSKAASLTVLPLPAAGRPDGFSGAVGRFTVTRTIRPTALQAGDPVTVRTVISGAGSIGAFSCGSISAPGLRSYPPGAAFTAKTFTCEQVVIPETTAVQEIPAVSVSFFDPERQRYRSATSGALPLRVTAPPPAATVAPAVSPVRKPPADSVPPGVIVVCLLLAAGIGGYLVRRSRWRSRPEAADVAPSRALRRHLAAAEAALAEGDVEVFYTAAFRALQASVGRRLNLSAAGITSPLPVGSFPAAVSQAAHHILAQCDRVRYGKQRPCSAEMADDLLQLRSLVNLLPPSDPHPQGGRAVDPASLKVS